MESEGLVWIMQDNRQKKSKCDQAFLRVIAITDDKSAAAMKKTPTGNMLSELLIRIADGHNEYSIKVTKPAYLLRNTTLANKPRRTAVDAPRSAFVPKTTE